MTSDLYVVVAEQLLARRLEGSKYFERRIFSNSLRFQNEIMTRAAATARQRQLQNDPWKIISFFQKPSLKYAA
jgi:hypothetical protein